MHLIHIKLQQLIYIARHLWTSADRHPAPSTNKVSGLWERPEALDLIYSLWCRAGLRWSEVLAWEKREVAYAIDLEPEASLMFCWEVLHSAGSLLRCQSTVNPSPTLSTRKYQGSQFPQPTRGSNAAEQRSWLHRLWECNQWALAIGLLQCTFPHQKYFFSVWLSKQHYWGSRVGRLP